MNQKLEEKTIFCESLEDLPTLSVIESFERGVEYIIFFCRRNSKSKNCYWRRMERKNISIRNNNSCNRTKNKNCKINY